MIDYKEAKKYLLRRQPVAEIDLYFRMEAGASWHADSDENLEIAKILSL